MFASLGGTAAAIDGETLISQSMVIRGGITPEDKPGFPVTIARPGAYKLASDLSVPADKVGISITGVHIELNLNGWGIYGNGIAKHAIRSDKAFVKLIQGRIAGFKHVAFFSDGALEQVHFSDNKFSNAVGDVNISNSIIAGTNVECRGSCEIRNSIFYNSSLIYLRLSSYPFRSADIFDSVFNGWIQQGRPDSQIWEYFDGPPPPPSVFYGRNAMLKGSGRAASQKQLGSNVCDPQCQDGPQ